VATEPVPADPTPVAYYKPAANHDCEQTTNPITDETAPSTNDSHSPISLVEPSANRYPNRSSKPLLPLVSPTAHHARLPTSSHPRSPFVRRPNPLSPHQMVTWHPVHAPPQRMRPPCSAHTPVSPIKRPAPVTTLPQGPTEHTPTAIVHGPRNLSSLRSDAPNPWGSLRRQQYSRFSHTPRRFTRRRQYPPTGPVNSDLPTTPIPKPPAPTSIHVFETVRHPHGIGPNKPVIRVPARMEIAKSTYPAPSDQAIAKSTPPLHPAAPVQCCCGQLAPVSGNQVFRSFPLHHTFSSFISQFISLSFPFPRQLFSPFTFS
jgi:hypothetical protein